MHMDGLLPPRVNTQDQQAARFMKSLRAEADALHKYISLSLLQNRNEYLFYRVVVDNIEECLPLIYTPTVGQACQNLSAIFKKPRGLFLSMRDKGNLAHLMRNWPYQPRLIVATDGERILGLGDLGCDGMGIPIGKLSLYTACAGLHPYYTLPIMLDVGTNNEPRLKDPYYFGIPERRATGKVYDEFIDEFVKGVKEVFGSGCLLQWEDFGNSNAFRLLKHYREKVLSFNDDIQGTAAVSVAGLFASARITKTPVEQNTILFQGAGEAGTGIADLFVAACAERGVPAEIARNRCYFMDSTGLVCKSRLGDLAHHKIGYAQDHEFIKGGPAGILEAVKRFKPTAIIGVSGIGKSFTQEIVAEAAKHSTRPVVMALSNPTSCAECTAQEAYDWSEGRCIFISGSPFPPVQYGGRTYNTGQGNNVYIFPGVGLGAIGFQAKWVPDEMFLAAAKVLAGMATDADLAVGRAYPGLTRIREVSAKIATAVGEIAYRDGLARLPRPNDLETYVRSCQWDPHYPEYFKDE